MRFLDHIRRESKEYLDEDAIAELSEIPIIVADNVTQYFFAENDKEYWSAKDFPNVAPPFPLFWIETKKPTLANSKEKGQHEWTQYAASMWGSLCIGTTYKPAENFLTNEYGRVFFLRSLETLLNHLIDQVFPPKDLNAALERNFAELEKSGEIEFTEEITLPLTDERGQHMAFLKTMLEHAKSERWKEVAKMLRPILEQNRFSLEMCLYVRMPHIYTHQEINMGPMWYYRFELNERGEVIHFPDSDQPIGIEITMPMCQAWIEAIADGLQRPLAEVSTDVRNHFLPLSQVALMTLSFLHCKNVELEETRPAYQPVYNKQAKKRGVEGFQPTLYKTLNIYPMSPSSPSERKQANGGGMSGKRMHIARGHFRDYTEGGGLFGKYHGLFWVPQHIRGSKEAGTIAKDYKVSTKHIEEKTR